MIMIEHLRLGYQGVPKVATTSIYHWLYASINGAEALTDGARRGAPNATRRYFTTGNNNGSRVDNTAGALSTYQAYFRFALTRDPVRRFLSMYSNRVVHHRGLSRTAKCAEELVGAGLVFNPQINEMISQLDAYLKAAKVIMHHSRPMMDFLGPELSVYNRLADISEAGTVIEEIKAYWQREGMMDILKRAPAQLGHRQTGGPKLGLEVLTPESFERLLDYYREDYARIPLVSLQAIKNDYFKARSGAPVAQPVVFSAARGETQTGRQRKRGIGGAVAETKDCLLVQAVKVNLPKSTPELGKPFALRGIVLLNPEVETHAWELMLSDGASERPCQWRLPSPKLVQKFRNNPRAATARFRLAGVRFVGGEPLRMYLQNSRGERHLLLQVRATD